MPTDPYDQSSRYLLKRNERVLSAWLLALKQEQGQFQQWLDTRTIPWPGKPEKICDTVAWLDDLGRDSLPWAVLFEFQSDPAPDMLGRLLIYLGSVWLEKRPSAHPGDRFRVAAVVVHLRGRGRTWPEMDWPEAGVRVVVQPREWNLEEMDAEATLDAIAAGTIPRPVLAWVPCMRGGDNPNLIPRWRNLADLETDSVKRSDLGLVRVFAEAGGCDETWNRGLEGWNVTTSKLVNEWQAEAKMGMLVRLVSRKFAPVPEEVLARIRATKDTDRLDAWNEAAGLATSLDQFRADTGL
jgi:hypothetical protein